MTRSQAGEQLPRSAASAGGPRRPLVPAGRAVEAPRGGWVAGVAADVAGVAAGKMEIALGLLPPGVI
ncbi:MAG TPA: hypothetical protein VG253_05890 [Streptosporangiaceae bacterium]|nr:hypothetical protein [Streptosporangiaceae bacterium]